MDAPAGQEGGVGVRALQGLPHCDLWHGHRDMELRYSPPRRAKPRHAMGLSLSVLRCNED